MEGSAPVLVRNGEVDSGVSCGPVGSPSWRHGMTASGRDPGPRIRDVRVLEDAVRVDLEDGRTLTVPLAWFPGLLRGARASPRG